MLIYPELCDKEAAMAAYFEEKTGIKIRLIAASEEDYASTLVAYHVAGQSPDVACLYGELSDSEYYTSFFEPLSGYLDLTETIYDSEAMEQYKYDGEYYGAVAKSSEALGGAWGIVRGARNPSAAAYWLKFRFSPEYADIV